MGALADVKKSAAVQGAITRALDSWMLKQAAADTHRIDGKFHPSSISGCPTACAYEVCKLGGKTPFDAKLLRIFAQGTAIHRMIQHMLIEAGIIVVDGNKKPLVEVGFEIPELEVVGAADGIVALKRLAVLEIKSINTDSFKLLKEPKPEHKEQAIWYVLGLKEFLGDSTDALFLYYSKNDSDIKEFLVTFQPADFERIKLKHAAAFKMVSEFKATGKIPEPFYDDPAKPPCRRCNWQHKCHSTLDRAAWIEKIEKENPDVQAAKAAVAKAEAARPQPARRMPGPPKRPAKP